MCLVLQLRMGGGERSLAGGIVEYFDAPFAGGVIYFEAGGDNS